MDVISDNAPALSATTDAVLTPPAPLPTSASGSAADRDAGRATIEQQPVFKPAVEAVEAAAEPAATEVAAEPTEAVEPATEAAATEVVADKPAAEPKGVAKRLAELVAQREAATRLADLERDKAAAAATKMAELEARLAELTKPAAAEPAADPRPTRQNFDTPDAYDAALTRWAAREGAREATAQFDARTAAQAKTQAADAAAEATRAADAAARTAMQANAKVWGERRIEAMSRIPDYEAVAENPDLQITRVMAEVIVRAKNGPDLAYHLGKNPELTSRLAAMPAPEAMFELADIAASLRVPAPVTVSKAPAPIRPVTNQATAREKSPAEMTMNEYAARRNGQLPQRAAFLPDGKGAIRGGATR